MNESALLDPPCLERPIDVVDGIAPADFKRNYLQKGRPVLLRGMTAHWPAMQKWSFEFFSTLKLDQDVFLEEANVMQGTPRYLRMPYREYLSKLLATGHDHSAPTYYLSVFKILRAFPELRRDFDFDFFSQYKLKNTVAAWLGPAGTVTGFHIDWGDNVLAQVVGRKQIRLVGPEDSACMYPTRRFDQGTTSSAVDLDNLDEERFPRFRHARQGEVILQPGEILFIPRGWWHYVRSLDPSISVSNIGYDLRGVAVDLVSHRMKQILHDRGLYRRDCTCHYWEDGQWRRRSISN